MGWFIVGWNLGEGHMTFAIGQVPAPDLAALLVATKRDLMERLNCHQWGTVQAFDATKQTADVQIGGLRQVVDYTQSPPVYVAKQYPLLLAVPVMVISGGDAALTMPIAAGDTCLLLFNDRDFDAFWEAGTPALPNTGRLHDFSDALAIVGFRTKANPVADYDTARVRLYKGDTQLALGTKVRVENAAKNLHDVLSNLITTLKAFTDTRGDTPNAATITALNANQAEIDALLE